MDQSLFDVLDPAPRTTGLFEKIPDQTNLTAAATLLPEMAAIRAHIAGNSTGITRDETIIEELVKILHAKTYDEFLLQRQNKCRFYWLQGETPSNVRDRIQELLQEAHTSVEDEFGRSAADSPRLKLDPESVAFAVSALHRYSVLSSERDILGEAYESLIGPSLRGAEGQFFTPRNLTTMCVAMMNPEPGESIIDPACGAGGFLGDTLHHLSEKRSNRASLVVGIDKDEFLATLCADRLSLYHREHHVFCENSLAPSSSWSERCQSVVSLGAFDVVLTNPPFGASIPVKGDSLLQQYDLARKWARCADGKMAQTDRLMPKRPPQVLFIERCIQLLRPGGRAAIVLPEGVFGNESEQYIRQWILNKAQLLAVADCPLETFMPSTPTKTCVLFLRKRSRKDPEDQPVFFAVAENCGHNRRGKPVYTDTGARKDDFPQIAEEYIQKTKGK